MHFKWKYEPPTLAEEQAGEELSEKLNMSAVLGRVLIRRGITTESAAKRFFRPQLNDILNPFLMWLWIGLMMLWDARSAS